MHRHVSVGVESGSRQGTKQPFLIAPIYAACVAYVPSYGTVECYLLIELINLRFAALDLAA